jgi:hypothetical protein
LKTNRNFFNLIQFREEKILFLRFIRILGIKNKIFFIK